MTVYEDTMARLVELERENKNLRSALESAIEALNHQADLVSEWSATKPSVYVIEDFL